MHESITGVLQTPRGQDVCCSGQQNELSRFARSRLSISRVLHRRKKKPVFPVLEARAFDFCRRSLLDRSLTGRWLTPELRPLIGFPVLWDSSALLDVQFCMSQERSWT